MAITNPGRESLRGKGEQAFDFISETLEPDEWAEWLRAPLERAAAKGKRDLARMLVGAGADMGNAPREAVRGGHIELLKDLLDNGASVSSADADGWTLLHDAAAEGYAEMVQLLMLRGADKDAMDKKRYTPLYRAVSARNHAAAIALVAGGADVNLRCGLTDTTLVCTAVREGGKRQVEILRALIEHGADVKAGDIDGDTALHVASEHDEVEAVAVLVEAGADIEARGLERRTPLHAAARRLSLRVLAALLEHGANANAQRTYHNVTPLHCAATFSSNRRCGEVVDLLLRSGADETLLDDENATPVDYARDILRAGCSLANRVVGLLTNAPADRAWRRRGYLVLCRAHPDRVQHGKGVHGTAQEGAAQKTRGGGVKLARKEQSSVFDDVEGCINVEERNGAYWAGVVARVLELKEEGIFRAIVGYL